MLEIILAGNKTEYAPGEKIVGNVRWGGANEPPDGLVVGLMYRTEGRGTQDTVHLDEVDVATAVHSGEHGFQFVVPDSPYTFDGTLISLRWFVEASCSAETELKPIVVSPWVETVRLSEVKKSDLDAMGAALNPLAQEQARLLQQSQSQRQQQ